MLAQILFVVWRESVEALLVVGILHAWLAHNGSRVGLRFLWGGVLAGILVALGLSALVLAFESSLPPGGQDLFQAGLVTVAAVLIVQMVFWMRRNGRTLKRELEEGLKQRLETGSLWGIFFLSTVAIAREGSETVIFLYGIVSAGAAGSAMSTLGTIAVAFAGGVLTYWLLQVTARRMSWRYFFKGTEIMLLLLASALLVKAAGYLVAFGVLPYTQPLWSTDGVLSDTTLLGSLIAALTGYRSDPDIVTLSTWVLFWGAMTFVFWRDMAKAQTAGTGRH